MHYRKRPSAVTSSIKDLANFFSSIDDNLAHMLEDTESSQINKAIQQMDHIVYRELSKSELNMIAKQLISMMKKMEKYCLSAVDTNNSNFEDEILINISNVKDKHVNNFRKSKRIFEFSNKILESLLVIVKFKEKWKDGFFSKGLINKATDDDRIVVKSNLTRSTALELGNLALHLFDNVRTQTLSTKNELYPKLLNQYMFFSFCLMCCVSPFVNHTINLHIKNEKILFMINYVLNKNNELTDYFLVNFSKIFDETAMLAGLKKKHKKSIAQYDEDKASTDCVSVTANPKFKNYMDDLQDYALNFLNMVQFNFEDFFKNQFIKKATNSTIETIMMIKRSHRFVFCMEDFIISKILHHKRIYRAFLQSYDEQHKNYTVKIFEKMFKMNHKLAEKFLKSIIIQYHLSALFRLFYDKCITIDSAYIECLFICRNYLDHITYAMLEKLLNSYYLNFVIDNKLIFQKLTTRISDYVLHLKKKQPQRKFDDFFRAVVDKMVINQNSKWQRQSYEMNKNKSYATISISNLTLNLSKRDLYQTYNCPNNISFEILERSLFFLNTFPDLFDSIVPFLHRLLLLFNKEYRSYKNCQQNEQVNTSLSTFDHHGICVNDTSRSHMLDTFKTDSVVRFSQIFSDENTLLICKILNLTRDFIDEWSFADMFRNLNTELFMEHVVFNEHYRADSLFVHSLQTVINGMKTHHDCMQYSDCNDKSSVCQTDGESKLDISNSIQHSFFKNKNSATMNILRRNLEKKFINNLEFDVYMARKQIDFSNLYQKNELRELMTKYGNIQDIIKKQTDIEHNFYDNENEKKTLNSFSVVGDRSVLIKKPTKDESSDEKKMSIILKNNSAQTDECLVSAKNAEKSSNNDCSSGEIAGQNIAENSFVNQKTEIKNLRICDIDDTFSTISVHNSKHKALEKKRNVVFFSDLGIELLTQYQKKKIIEIELLKKKPDKKIIGCCLQSLFVDYKYVSGLVFNNSKILINKNLNNFCLYSRFHQYSPEGDQFLIIVRKNKGYVALVIRNNQLLKISVEKTTESAMLLHNPPDNLYTLGIKFNGKVLHIKINEIKLSIVIRKITSIEIGANFKGIVPRVLFYENMSYSDDYLENMDNVCFYVKYINKLEKKCQYYNHNGVLIDNVTPYFLSKTKFNVVMKNIRLNAVYDFLNSKKFCSYYVDKIKTDPNLNTVLENYR